MKDGQQRAELRIAGYIKPVPRHAAHEERARIAWPDIAEYWPDSPTALLPPNAHSVAHEDPDDQRNRSWVRGPVVLTGMTALLVVFGTVLLARPLANSEIAARPVAAPTGPIQLDPIPVASPSPSFSFSLPPAAASPSLSPSPSASTAPAAPKRARFEFVSGVTVLSVRIMDLDGDSYRVTSPDGAAVDAETTFSGGVLRVDVKSTDSGTVEVALSRETVWHLSLGAGVKTLNFDSTEGTVSRIDLDGGAESMNLFLGKLAGVVPVRMTGGVGSWAIHTVVRIPTRVYVRAGAGNVTLYGKASGGTAPGAVLGNDDLGKGPALDIEATGGMGSLEVKRS
ncbi:hypothetical protein [Actinoplanes couchii]|uniref:Adhesin domain-containing protein n=1 Tax=Actinoplanes couchii TaxID=403638 RepID=A0ABQ3XQH6_9ACTN|nr:hypothetical protein [Actinoplanes couchii]MDR6317460.1 hypothetical protein [Actinoplanes couchii]GID60761.1 hypothetical protein Aco03nite_091650 [Actinoplanes couchii]